MLQFESDPVYPPNVLCGDRHFVLQHGLRIVF